MLLLAPTSERIKITHFPQVVFIINKAHSFGNNTSVPNGHINYRKACFQLKEICASFSALKIGHFSKQSFIKTK